MYSRLTLFAVCVWVLANPTTGLSDAITLDPKIFLLDSFNLIADIAFDGKSIWVAGFDHVVRLNANYTVAQRVKVDGHIASLGLGSDGAIYVADDKTVWQISRGSETLKKIPALGINNCSQNKIVTSGSFVWLLNSCEVKNGSASSVFSSLLLRIDPKTGERNVATLATVGDGGSQLLINRDKVWVNTDFCNVVDKNALEIRTFRPDRAASLGPLSGNAHRVYLVAAGSDAGPQFVIAIDPNTLKETAR